jgi:hypothetical protein
MLFIWGWEKKGEMLIILIILKAGFHFLKIWGISNFVIPLGVSVFTH